MKRLLALALLAAATPASAQTDVVRLAPGEIPLHIVAQGRAVNPADRLILTVPITATGTSATEARTAAARTVARVTAALTAQGVPAAAITVGAGSSQTGFAGNEEDGDEMPAAALAAMALAGASSPHRVTTMMQVGIDHLAALPRVERALDAIDQPAAAAPTLLLRDDAAARRAAIADAVAQARQQADAYAAALGLRVVRVLAIGNRPASGADPLAGWTLYASLLGARGTDRTVETRARVEIDYALAPR